MYQLKNSNFKGKTHQEFVQEREQHHEQNYKLKNSKIKPFSPSTDNPYRIILFIIPVIAIALVSVGLIHENLSQNQKYYCFKSPFIKTGYPNQITPQLDRKILVNTRYSFKMYVDLYDTTVGKKIAQYGSFQPAQINLIGQIIKDGDQVLIVGGHQGLEALVAGYVIGQDGKLLITAPTNLSYGLMQKNLKQNKLNSISTVFNIYPSNTQSIINVSVISSIKYQSTDKEPVYSIESVTAKKLDSIIPANIQLNFVYINTGGQKNQLQILEGMRDIVKRSSNKLVVMIRWRFGKSVLGEKSMLEYFTKYGYKFYTYKGGSYRQSCSVGQFTYQSDNNVFQNKPEYLLLFPQGYQLSK